MTHLAKVSISLGTSSEWLFKVLSRRALLMYYTNVTSSPLHLFILYSDRFIILILLTHWPAGRLRTWKQAFIFFLFFSSPRLSSFFTVVVVVLFFLFSEAFVVRQRSASNHPRQRENRGKCQGWIRIYHRRNLWPPSAFGNTLHVRNCYWVSRLSASP